MTSDEITRHAIDALNRLGIPYMLVGSLSTNVYGIPRATRDADFVVQTTGEVIAEFARALSPLLSLDPQLSFETVTNTTRYVLKAVDSSFRIQLLLSNDPHDVARFTRRVARDVEGQTVWLPTVEDVVVFKLHWYHRARRSKDIEDIRNVIAVQHKRVDWAYVEHWCEKHGTRELLDQVRSSIPGM